MPRSPRKLSDPPPALPPSDEVRIGEIICDEKLQARAKINSATVRSYRQAYVSGAAFPPVRIALVDDVPMLVDGWHRLEALKSLGRTTVDAVVTKASMEEAMGLAAQANLGHGLQLTRSERKAAFRLYVMSRGHLDAGKRPKSYRDMAADRGESHSTLYNWTKELFPKLAKRLGKPGVTGKGGLADWPSQEKTRYHEVCQLLDQALSQSRGVKDANMRGYLLTKMRDVLKRAEAAAPFIEPLDYGF